jgi:hypothetical protein
MGKTLADRVVPKYSGYARHHRLCAHPKMQFSDKAVFGLSLDIGALSIFRPLGHTVPVGSAIGQAILCTMGPAASTMYQLTARVIGGLLIACGLTLAAIGIGAFLFDANGAFTGGVSFLVFASVFGFAGYRFLRTPVEESEAEPTRQRSTSLKIPQPLIVKFRRVLGPLSAVVYLACWTSLPITIVRPIATGLVWTSFVIWFLAKNSRGTPHWNRLSKILLAVIWCLHAAAWHFVQEVPHVDRFDFPLYALTVVGPDVYSRMMCASNSLTAFVVLLGPWQRSVWQRRPKAG